MNKNNAIEAVQIRIDGLTRVELKALQSELGSGVKEFQSSAASSGQGSFPELCAYVVVSGASATSALYAIKKTIDASAAVVISAKKLHAAIKTNIKGEVKIKAFPMDADPNEDKATTALDYDPNDAGSASEVQELLDSD